MKPSYFILALSILSPLYGETKTFPIENMNLNLMSAEWGKSEKNKSTSGKPLSLRGKKIDGIGTHAYSKMIIELEGKGERFTSLVGVDDHAEGGSIIFKLSDETGKILFESETLTQDSNPLDINIDIKGVKKLTLEVLPSTKGNDNDHAVWGKPLITMKDGTPLAIPEFETIALGTKNISLGFYVNKDKVLMQQYLGAKTTPGYFYAQGIHKDPAYPTMQSLGEIQYQLEPALHVTHADGHQSTFLEYQSHKTEELDKGIQLTKITLKDPNYDFFVDLCFKQYEKEDVIEQWTEMRNEEEGNIILQNFASANLALHGNEPWLTSFSGGWAGEGSMTEEKLTTGSKVIESRKGITSSHGYQQHFIISLHGQPEENNGPTIIGTLAWSGNYKMSFEKAPYNVLNVNIGMNPWASQYTLGSGKSFSTPPLIYTYSPKGKGEASRRLHQWALHHGIRDGEKPLRSLFNNWEATGMDTSDKRIVPFFQPAKDLGFELFLLDDGWFGLPNQPRILGEWEPSTKIHPKGMSVLLEEAGKAGIDFGLWVEMEMANPDARLIKDHPEWLLCEPKRPHYKQRGQYVLDLTNPDVQNFCISAFNKILKDNPGITFVKWDCNSSFNNPYSQNLGNNQSHLWIDYTHGLYKIFEACVKANPDLEMMLCSAGGARADYGSLKYFHEFWPSDNTNPASRVFIQWGHSQVFPAKTIAAHVTHMGNHDFKFAFDVAMSGRLGMDADPTKMSEKEIAISKRCLELYNTKLRPIIQLGELYRLQSPYHSPAASLMYVSNDKKQAALFFYRIKNESNSPIKLEGLDPNKSYTLEEVNIDSPDKALCTENGSTLSGKDLMEKGITFKGNKQYESATLYIVEKP